MITVFSVLKQGLGTTITFMKSDSETITSDQEAVTSDTD